VGDEGGIGSLFGKAAKWLENATKQSEGKGDATTAEEQDALQEGMKDDLQQLKDDGTIDRIAAEVEEKKAADAAAAEAASHADRESRAAGGGTHLVLAGEVSATLDSGLAVDVDREDGALWVNIEPVDPIEVQGGTFTGIGFGVPQYHGPGSYDIATVPENEVDYTLFTIAMGDQSEGYLWHPSYGPGTVTVSPDESSADIHFLYQSPGGGQVDVTGTVSLK
jgi:hypothetical protein